ncbi:MAG: TlpA family protein disulfide reductase [Planctomycetes bacterium]|nr:TlpA family protein disulfide reductase [Planctomycetota bacterium]
MKFGRTWLLPAALALAPILSVTTQAQKANEPAPQEQKRAGFDSARALLKSFDQLATKTFKNPGAPTPDEVGSFFAQAWPRVGLYLDDHPDAKDADSLYGWAVVNWGVGCMRHGYGRDGFIKLGRKYLEDKPYAKDREGWHMAVILASLGHEDYRDDADKELAKLEAECDSRDAMQFLTLVGVRLDHACRQKNDVDLAAYTEKARKHPAVVASTDVSVQRKLFRVVMGTHQVQLKEGAKFPDWAEVMPVKDFSGKELKLSDYKGKVLLIDFWAMWWRPCVTEMPELAKLYNETHAKGLEVIGVNLDLEQDEKSLKSYLSGSSKKNYSSGVVWPQVFDGGRSDSGLARRYGVTQIPHTILIDSQGRVAALGLRGEDLADKVYELLGLERLREQKPDLQEPVNPPEKTQPAEPGEDQDEQY